MITAKNIKKHELIGLWCEVLYSTNKNQEGIKGVVEDETKNMLCIQGKKIQKKYAKFRFTFGKEDVIVNGDELLFRPEDRTKRC